MVLVIGMVAAGIRLASDEVGVSEEYFAYLATSPGEMVDRVERESIGSLRVTYQQSGFWGKGIGSASTGMRHLGVGMRASWQEGGLGKVMVELGVPGLVGAVVLAGAIAHSLAVNRRRTVGVPGHERLLAGLTACLVANGASFICSHQLYSDVFVTVFTAFLIGVALSSHTWDGTDMTISDGRAEVPPLWWHRRRAGRQWK